MNTATLQLSYVGHIHIALF